MNSKDNPHFTAYALGELDAAQAREIQPAQMWGWLAHVAQQGLPDENEQRGLDRTRSEDRRYYGGALFWLTADVEIRKRTANRFGARDAIRAILRYYTREAGVRSLERELGKICRKVVKGIQLKQYQGKVVVDENNLNDFLGVRKFDFGRVDKKNQVGQVVGLAWTEVGGDLLTIEAAVMPGKGNIIRTGQLGDVMKESVEAARSVVRSRAARLGIKDEAFEKRDIHIHVPDGATPKDGPSAGIAMTTAFVSALSGIPVKADVAMTGEITLRGEVTAIGGLKEKLLAAHRGGIKTVLIPEENVKDLQEIPENAKNKLEIVPVRWIDQVLEVALERVPKPLPEDEPAKDVQKVADGAPGAAASDALPH